MLTVEYIRNSHKFETNFSQSLSNRLDPNGRKKNFVSTSTYMHASCLSALNVDNKNKKKCFEKKQF